MKREIAEEDLNRISTEMLGILSERCSIAGITNSLNNLDTLDLLELNNLHREFAIETEYIGRFGKKELK
ncbi:hypothetical protein [Paenibacillus sp. YIM B09110]|uniref:hypothetical protein n=1 Tax=Paenibacillus sp. YIM B09110 TaxID=3126102 RepID=UPI00301BAB8F